MKLVLGIATVAMLIPCLTWAGCISDCKDEYESATQSCQMLWGDDPESDYMLDSCMDQAKYDYDSCEEDCQS